MCHNTWSTVCPLWAAQQTVNNSLSPRQWALLESYSLINLYEYFTPIISGSDSQKKTNDCEAPSVSSEHYVWAQHNCSAQTLHPVWIRIYSESVWQCMNCFTYQEMDHWARRGTYFPMMYAYMHMALCVYTYECVCVVCVCSSICCHPSGPLVRPQVGVHNVKAAAVAPVAPPCPPRGAPPNLLPGRLYTSHAALLTVKQWPWWLAVSFSFSPGPRGID